MNTEHKHTPVHVPSREPITLTDEQVARMPHAAVIRAAYRGGSDPEHAITAQEQAKERADAVTAVASAAAQRVVSTPR